MSAVSPPFGARRVAIIALAVAALASASGPIAGRAAADDDASEEAESAEDRARDRAKDRARDRAEARLPHHWSGRAWAYYQASRWDDVLSEASEHQTDEHLVSEVLVFFASLEKSLARRDPDAARAWRELRESLTEGVGAAEVGILAAIGTREDPTVRLWAERLLDRALRRLVEEGGVELLRVYVESPDSRVRAHAIAATARLIASLRRAVDRGGSLTPSQQEVFTDEALVRILIRNVGDEQVHRARMVLLPSQLAELGAGDAHACLVLIETPAIPALREAIDGGAVHIARTLTAIGESIDRRLRRWPGSTWNSARGERPVAGFLGAFCTACKVQLPMDSKFCSGCGGEVRTHDRVTCPKCRRTLPGDARFCDDCGVPVIESGGGSARICPNPACKERLSAEMTFCPRCGRRVRLQGP